MTMLKLLSTEPHVKTLPIRDLISLEQAGIPGGALAMRELDALHVQDLVNSDASTWPAIKVATTTLGYIVVDGYHRLEAATCKGETTLDALIQSYATENEVVEAAFRANLFHGRKAGTETRGDYAYWLHIAYPDLSQEEIARRTRISQPAVSKAIAKREAALRDAALEAMGRRKHLNTMRACKQFSQRVIRFAREVETISDADLLTYLHESAKQKEQREKLVRLGQLLVDAYSE